MLNVRIGGIGAPSAGSVLLGDLNVAHLDADIWNVTAKHIPKSAGCTPREREAFGQMLADGPYVDCFRHLWPEATGAFSYWSTRSGNQVRPVCARRAPPPRRHAPRLPLRCLPRGCRGQRGARASPSLTARARLAADASPTLACACSQLLNRGLRLDYAVASASLTEAGGSLRLHDCAYMAEYAPNGDHAPSLVALARSV